MFSVGNNSPHKTQTMFIYCSCTCINLVWVVDCFWFWGWGHNKQPCNVGLYLIWLLTKWLEFDWMLSLWRHVIFRKREIFSLFVEKPLFCYPNYTRLYGYLLFIICIEHCFFSLLFTTLCKQICYLFLSHDPPVEKRCFKTFTACSNGSF